MLSRSTFIVNYAFDDLNKLSHIRHAKRYLPQSGWLVANNENRLVIVFLLDVLAQLVECPIEVLFLSGQKNPARAGVKLLRVFFHSRRRVGLRVDRHRDEEDVAADAVT